jgi:hypothetical protein
MRQEVSLLALGLLVPCLLLCENTLVAMKEPTAVSFFT